MPFTRACLSRRAAASFDFGVIFQECVDKIEKHCLLLAGVSYVKKTKKNDK